MRWPFRRRTRSTSSAPQDSFDRTFFSREDRYWLGICSPSGKYFASTPVMAQVVDYSEYYALTRDQYDRFMADRPQALEFIEACRRRERDDLLMQKPGWNRGTPR